MYNFLLHFIKHQAYQTNEWHDTTKGLCTKDQNRNRQIIEFVTLMTVGT